MKTLVIMSIAAICSSPLCLQAQNVGDPYINSSDVINAGVEHYDAGDFKRSIEDFSKVAQGDSLYTLARYELALAYIADSQYVNATEILRASLSDPLADRLNTLTLLGTAYERLERYDEAVATFDQSIAEFGYLNTPYFEKAGTMNSMKKYQEALDLYAVSLRNNPYHAATHMNIGFLAADAGEPTLAILALFMGITTGGNSELNLTVLAAIEEIGHDRYQKVRTNVPSSIFSFASELDEIDEVVKSKSAFNKKYKSLVKMDLAYAKQLQVISELLPKNIDSQNPILQFYHQFYKNAWDNGHFVGMATLPMGSINVPAAQKLAKKNKAKGEKYESFAVENINKYFNPQEITFKGKKEKTTVHWVNLRTAAFGNVQNGNEDGYWHYFHPNGVLAAEGNYVQGKKDGIWKYYHTNGRIKKEERLKMGEFDGYEKQFSDYGVPTQLVDINSSQNGKIVSYQSNGIKLYEAEIKVGKPDGKVLYYNKFEEKDLEFNLVNDAPNGKKTEYHYDGSIKAQYNIVNNLIQDELITYHPNGKEEAKGKLAKGEREGEWKFFHMNGQPYQTGSYKSGKKIGEWIMYNEQGVVMEKEMFSNSGEMDGLSKYYDGDGKLLREIDYKNGKAVTITHYHGDGTQLHQSKSKDGVIDVVYYNHLRQKIREGRFGKNGYEGLLIECDVSGMKTSETQLKDGKADGIKKTFYPSGALLSEVKYVDGLAQGFAKYYFRNGQIETTKYYKDDVLHGPSIEYYPDGQKSEEEFYWNGVLNGVSIEYTPDGIPVESAIYEMDVFCGIINYDEKGKSIHVCPLKNGHGDLVSKYKNGAVKTKATCQNGLISGKREDLHPDSSVFQTSEYKAGFLHGNTERFQFGNLMFTGSYSYGNRHGNWTFYELDGLRDYETSFYYNQDDSVTTFYHKNGSVRRRLIRHHGMRTGDEYIYAEDGSIAIVRRYFEDALIAYSYEDKNHKLVPFISVDPKYTEVKAYYANGKPSASFVIKNGEYDGDLTFLNSNGKPFASYQYQNGMEQGLTKEYGSNGVLMDEFTQKDGAVEGQRTVYYPNGKIKYQLTYRSGVLHGPAKIYDKNGKLVKEGECYNGEFFAK